MNYTSGMGSIEPLKQAGEKSLSGKVLIDIANPLDLSKCMPPTLYVCNTDSLTEQIQRAFQNTKVDKPLNTVNAAAMIMPSLIPADHDMFIGGNDASANTKVADSLKNMFGWRSVIDLGDITNARGME